MWARTLFGVGQERNRSGGIVMPERKPVIPPGAAPNPALSPGVIVGDLLFVSGHVATDSSGTVVGEGDAEAQSRQIMTNIQAVVTAAGGKMEDVAKITCFVTDIAYYPGYSKVRAETWPKDPPASSTVVVAGLVRPEFLVEVEAIVRLPT
jgi:enamine deaminase RidA (YjgF/YER057c/UK114 family)